MQKMIDFTAKKIMGKFFKAFNCPGKFFEALGYITVVFGLIMFVVGIFNACTSLSSYNSVGAPDAAMLNTGIGGVSLIVSGIITAVVVPQIFFAISKVVKAAEKYLEEK